MIVRVSPGSPSQWKATLSPPPASTCRSRQLYEALSVPPANHVTHGGVPLHHRVPVREPGEPFRLLGPERLEVGVGSVVDLRVGHDRSFDERRRRRERPVPPRAGPRCSARSSLIDPPEVSAAAEDASYAGCRDRASRSAGRSAVVLEPDPCVRPGAMCLQRWARRGPPSLVRPPSGAASRERRQAHGRRGLLHEVPREAASSKARS